MTSLITGYDCSHCAKVHRSKVVSHYDGDPDFKDHRAFEVGGSARIVMLVDLTESIGEMVV